jgi:hypothetical protein
MYIFKSPNSAKKKGTDLIKRPKIPTLRKVALLAGISADHSRGAAVAEGNLTRVVHTSDFQLK